MGSIADVIKSMARAGNIGEEEETFPEGTKNEEGQEEESHDSEAEEGETERVSGEEEGEGGEEEGEEGEEESEKDEVIDGLRGELAEMKAMLMEIKKGNVGEEEEEAFLPAIEYKSKDFVADEEVFEEATSTKEKFNEALNLAASSGAQQAIEHVTKTLPVVIAREARRLADATYYINQFWDQNNDIEKLDNAQEVASEVYNTLEKKYPGKSLRELFKMLPSEIRQAKKMGKPKSGKRKRTPGAPGTTSAQRTGAKPPEKKTTRSAIDEMKKVRFNG